jgi:hypothetical protein
LNDGVGHLVGVLLMHITALADSAFQLHTAALLDDVRGFVRRCMKARDGGERNVVSGGVGLGTDRAACGRGRSADVRLDTADVVPAEQALDPVGMRQRATVVGDSPCGGLLDRVAIGLIDLLRRRTRRALDRRSRDCAEVAAPGLSSLALDWITGVRAVEQPLQVRAGPWLLSDLPGECSFADHGRGRAAAGLHGAGLTVCSLESAHVQSLIVVAGWW